MSNPSIKLFAALVAILFLVAFVPVNPTWAGNPQQSIPTMPPDTETPTITNTPAPTNTLRPGETAVPPTSTPVPPSATALPPGFTPPAATQTKTAGSSKITPTNLIELAVTSTLQSTTDTLSTAANPNATSTITGLSAETIVPANPSGGGPTLTPTIGNPNQTQPLPGGLDWKWLILVPVVLAAVYFWIKSRSKEKNN